ncbi:hypothetical protein F0562_003900 [Nyssa sinensis]|uniref:Retrotransposon Copia-like N-terminal domain-containing protein n=1 Tax=Nyssa sinensis TaxID=561372 RepID=A0A5J5BXA9_9ASTE|nr:hypothetical protein F0562_003900 [Nyssa sinensis]
MASNGDNSQTSPPSFDDPSHPFYLHNSDHPGVTLVSHPLTDTNYNTWHQSMLIALSIKNKVGFIDGTVPKPSDPVAALQWTRYNNMVKAWLLNSLSKDISASVIYCDLAKDIWVELKERFSQVNGRRMFQLEQEIHNLVQSTTSVTTYFTKLKMLWDELSSLQSHLIHEGVSQYQQYQRTMKFLMGLNESYATIRGGATDHMVRSPTDLTYSIPDLRLIKMIGVGTERDGLYLLHKDKTRSLSSGYHRFSTLASSLRASFQ